MTFKPRKSKLNPMTLKNINHKDSKITYILHVSIECMNIDRTYRIESKALEAIEKWK